MKQSFMVWNIFYLWCQVGVQKSFGFWSISDFRIWIKDTQHILHNPLLWNVDRASGFLVRLQVQGSTGCCLYLAPSNRRSRIHRQQGQQIRPRWSTASCLFLYSSWIQSGFCTFKCLTKNQKNKNCDTWNSYFYVCK